jgi:DNA invertase Pin-like site-specific DNA recombinase
MKARLAIAPTRGGSCHANSTPILIHPPHKGDPVKRAALYLRVSTLDQNPETQGIELRQFAHQRGYEIVHEYVDHGVSGTKVRRPALDQLLKDANRHKFDAVLVWSSDRLARSTKHFLLVLDDLSELGI